MSAPPTLPEWIDIEPNPSDDLIPSRHLNRDADTRLGRESVTLTAHNKILRRVFGKAEISGRIALIGTDPTNLIICVIWCKGEINSISNIKVNNEPISVFATVTNYTGTQTQTADPVLSSTFPQTNSTHDAKGIAYSVLSFPPTTTSKVEEISAVIEGEKILDPRSGLTEYSNNVALVANQMYFPDSGLVLGVEECANYCDSPPYYNQDAIFFPPQYYEPFTCNLVISDLDSSINSIRKIAAYANLNVSRAGDKLVMSPNYDGKIADYLDKGDIFEYSLSTLDLSQAPSRVFVEFQEHTPPDLWQVGAAGKSDLTQNNGDSTIRMYGIDHAEQATHIAQRRFRSLRENIPISFVVGGIGIAYKRGQNVSVYRTKKSSGVERHHLARIISVDMISPFRYRVSAEMNSIS